MSDLDDKDKLKRKEAIINIRSRRELEDLGHVLSTPEGRRFIHYILDLTGFMKLSYSGPGKNEDTIFHEGQRNIGNNIFAKIKDHYRKEWLLMMDEQKLEEAKNA